MKKKDIAKKTKEELNALLEEKSKALFKEKMTFVGSRAKNTMIIRDTKKIIARIKERLSALNN